MTRPGRATEPPDFLTLEEAAVILRIGRSTAYREANAYEASGGATGIPVIRYGKQFRVPRRRLEEHLGGPMSWPPPKAPSTDNGTPDDPPWSHRHRAPRPSSQLSLVVEP